MLEVCKSEFDGIENVEFLQIDIRKPPKESLEGSFDSIFSSYCFMYISDQRNALQNIFDLLSPGGNCLVLQLSFAPFIKPFFTLAESSKWKSELKGLRDLYAFPFWEDPNPIFTVEDYMKSIGFIDISVTIQKNYEQIESQEHYKAFIESLPSPWKTLPEEYQEDFMNDLQETAKTDNLFKTNISRQSAPIKEPHQFLLIYGRKPE
ncbi:juvenile hormone acid O-methyltransferase-like [Phlebotomus argentipes]|uniref:juvenile hormone acid O-methyltransferase-like n=1 Tax=Phlebotomus argentipes TaxID=94469 RepID=UPI002892A3DD|nr:juvenile hormone acid O-methyltransferase-like [Phlebotomus argentipes]